MRHYTKTTQQQVAVCETIPPRTPRHAPRLEKLCSSWGAFWFIWAIFCIRAERQRGRRAETARAVRAVSARRPPVSARRPHRLFARGVVRGAAGGQDFWAARSAAAGSGTRKKGSKTDKKKKASSKGGGGVAKRAPVAAEPSFPDQVGRPQRVPSHHRKRLRSQLPRRSVCWGGRSSQRVLRPHSGGLS